MNRLTDSNFGMVALCCLFVPFVVRAEHSALAKEGLALTRIITSPVNIVGFTCAKCEGTGAGAVIVAPFALALECFPGTMAMCTDILTGTTELLTCQQFDRVAYPWESFDKRRAEKWDEIFSKTLDGVAEASEKAAVVANSVNEAANPSRAEPTPVVMTTTVAPDSRGSVTTSSDAATVGSSTTAKSTTTVTKPRPRVRHSSCGGTGKCPICRDRRVVGGKKCTGCGGTGVCRACRGSGYAP